MSTLPAEMVRLGSTCTRSDGKRETQHQTTYHDSNERVLELLISHLSVDIDTRQPAAVSRVGVVPPNRVLDSADLEINQMPQRISE